MSFEEASCVASGVTSLKFGRAQTSIAGAFIIRIEFPVIKGLL